MFVVEALLLGWSTNVYDCTNKSDREADRSFFRLRAIVLNQGDVCEQLSVDAGYSGCQTSINLSRFHWKEPWKYQSMFRPLHFRLTIRRNMILYFVQEWPRQAEVSTKRVETA